MPSSLALFASVQSWASVRFRISANRRLLDELLAKLAGLRQARASGGQLTMNLAARCPQNIRPDVRVLCGHLTIMTAGRTILVTMDHRGNLVSRKAESLVTEALADTRVVTLNGARQAGKSTLARITARGAPERRGPPAG